MGPLITPLLLVQTNVAYHRKKTASMMKLKVVRAARESRLQEGGKGEWGMGEGEWGGGQTLSQPTIVSLAVPTKTNHSNNHYLPRTYRKCQAASITSSWLIEL